MTDVLSWIRLPGPFLIGHRGFPDAARENTPQSFEAALEAGCDGVELDVRLTRDHVPVVHHDETVRSSSGSLNLAETDWPEIEGRRFEGRAGAYAIHRLEEVLEGLGGRGLLNVEVKPPGESRELLAAEVMATALQAVRPRESVLVSSFDPRFLGALRRRDASVFLGYLCSDRRALDRLEEEEIVDALTSLNPRHDLVDGKLMKRARERGLAVHTWTVDDPREARRVVELGVTAVITNRPDVVGGALHDRPRGA
jgi:glycerophosphoryl diester phosphodiesterase